MKQYLTDINDIRNYLKRLWRPEYIDRQTDSVILEMYNQIKNGLK